MNFTLLDFFLNEKNQEGKNQSAGFTLIEILVVIALISVISYIALPSINSIFKASLKTSAREVASTIRETYNSVTITGRVHRMVYNLKDQTYWVESCPKNILLDTESSQDTDSRKKVRFIDPKSKAKECDMDRTITRKKMTLPRGVKFTDIVTEKQKEPLTEGIAMTHLFPNGLTERTILHLEDTEKHKMSLILSGLVGKTEMTEGYVRSEDAFKK